MADITPEQLAKIRNMQMLIGRNILLFQNIEHILKLILLFGRGKGTVPNLIKRKQKIDELSFGRLTDINLIEKIDTKLCLDNDSEMTISYDLLPDNHDLVDAITSLNTHNEDRNFLVHHFAQRWQFDKSAHIKEASDWLTNQYNIIFKLREVLAKTLDLITERSKILLDDINSEAFKEAINEVNAMKKQDNTLSYTINYSKNIRQSSNKN